MEAIIISPQKVKKELLLALLSFILGNLLNVYAIAHYKTSWSELYQYLPLVLLLSGIIYLIILLVRAIIWKITRTYLKIRGAQ